MKVKKLKYNWRQVGSTSDRDGAGEDYDVFEIDQKGVVAIDEETNFSYTVHFEDWSAIKIFNPNYVEYFPERQV